MHNLVPQFITNRISQGEYLGKFDAAGLFVDLSGFSAMTSLLMGLGQHGAEILASLMRELFNPMINCVYQHNGFISTISGDAFTALFQQNENDDGYQISALACALEIQKIAAQKSHQQTPVGEFIISAKAGISIGETSWGVIPSPERNRAAYYFRGPVIEGCVASESHALAGEIIINPQSAELLKGKIVTQSKGDHFQLISVNAPAPPTVPIPNLQPDLEISNRFYPESILIQKETGAFRQIVNVFISLPTVRTEPQLEIFMRSLFNLQDRYGGLLNRLDFGEKGSHLLLFWGVPVTYENDIGRALNFVLALQSETSIPIKVGVTYRIAHAGFIGNQLREEFTCYGEGVNLAARFMMEANRGEIWVDEAIAKRVDEYYDLDLEGEFRFKGFEEPQKTYMLIERREDIKTFFRNPFLGREKAIERLERLAAPLWTDDVPEHVVIAGEPGMGKSRLASEFRNLLNNQGQEHHWARAQTDQMLRSSFNPIRYWAKNYFNIRDSQSDTRNKRNFNRKLDNLIAEIDHPGLVAELDRTRSFLGSLVNLFWEDSLFEQVESESRLENSIIALISLFLAESLRQPVFLFIEDVQWLDEPSKVFLQQLDRELKGPDRDYPIQIIGTSRDLCEEGCLGDGVSYQQVILNHLSDDEILALMRSQLGGNITPALGDSVIRFAEGNPFFSEQILLYLKENQKIIHTEDEWDLVEDSELILPEDVRAVLVARLDQAAPEINRLIRTASVLGREFEVNILSRMMGLGEDSLWELLHIAEESAIWTSVGDSRFVFQSNLMRDAAYQIQTLAQRKSIHQLAMKAIEEIYERDLSSRYPELAYHAEKGEMISEAIQYLRGAGKDAHRHFHNQQAIQYYSRAIVLFEETKSPEFFEILLERGRMYKLTGNREEQINDLRLADRIAKTSGNPELIARSHGQMAIYYSLMGDYLNGTWYATEAIKLAEQNELQDIAADAHFTLSNCARHQGDYKTARKEATLGIEISSKIEDLAGICMGLNALSLTTIQQGEFREAAKWLEQSLNAAREAEMFEFQAQTLNNLGNVYGEWGDYSSALRVFEQSLEIARMVGNRMGEGLVNTNLGWVAGLLGDYAASSEYLLEGINIALAIDDIYNHAYSLVNLGLFNCSQQKFTDAIEQLQLAAEILEEAGHKPGIAISHTYLGHANFGIKALKEAANSYQLALTIQQDLGQMNLTMEPLAGLAEIDLLNGNRESAKEKCSQILSFLEEGGTLSGIDQPFRIYTSCGRILLELEHPDTGQFIQDAYKTLQLRADRITDQQSRQSFLTKAPCHQEMCRLYQTAADQGLLPENQGT